MYRFPRASAVRPLACCCMCRTASTHTRVPAGTAGGYPSTRAGGRGGPGSAGPGAAIADLERAPCDHDPGPRAPFSRTHENPHAHDTHVFVVNSHAVHVQTKHTLGRANTEQTICETGRVPWRSGFTALQHRRQRSPSCRLLVCATVPSVISCVHHALAPCYFAVWVAGVLTSHSRMPSSSIISSSLPGTATSSSTKSRMASPATRGLPGLAERPAVPKPSSGGTVRFHTSPDFMSLTASSTAGSTWPLPVR